MRWDRKNEEVYLMIECGAVRAEIAVEIHAVGCLIASYEHFETHEHGGWGRVADTEE